jgi:hypothetical protein
MKKTVCANAVGLAAMCRSSPRSLKNSPLRRSVSVVFRVIDGEK